MNESNLFKMKDQSTPNLKDWRILLLSCGGLGFFPKAPGTVASLFTLPLLIGLNVLAPSFLLTLCLLVLVTGVICWITDQTQNDYKVHDPSWIVIDEVLGMLTAWIMTLPFVWPLPGHFLAALFLLFRFFDIVKIWPASFFDQKVKGGHGTILDDIVSGIYAGTLVVLISKFV